MPGLNLLRGEPPKARSLRGEVRISIPAQSAQHQQREQSTLKACQVPSKRQKDLIEGTADHHASLACPDLREVTIRWHGSFGYLTRPIEQGETVACPPIRAARY